MNDNKIDYLTKLINSKEMRNIIQSYSIDLPNDFFLKEFMNDNTLYFKGKQIHPPVEKTEEDFITKEEMVI